MGHPHPNIVTVNYCLGHIFSMYCLGQTHVISFATVSVCFYSLRIGLRGSTTLFEALALWVVWVCLYDLTSFCLGVHTTSPTIINRDRHVTTLQRVGQRVLDSFYGCPISRLRGTTLGRQYVTGLRYTIPYYSEG